MKITKLPHAEKLGSKCWELECAIVNHGIIVDGRVYLTLGRFRIRIDGNVNKMTYYLLSVEEDIPVLEVDLD